jgi:hypothetical protein
MSTGSESRAKIGFRRLGLIGAVPALVVAIALTIAAFIVFAKGNRAWEYAGYFDTATGQPVARTAGDQFAIDDLERKGSITMVWHDGSASDALPLLFVASLSLALGAIWLILARSIGWIVARISD